MPRVNRPLWNAAVLAALVAAAITVSAQSAIPTQGGRGRQGGAGDGRQGGQGRGGAGQPSTIPAEPVVAPMPTVTAAVTGPGAMFESLMELKAGDDMAHFKYEAKEYFVSGTANGQPYKTRIVIRKPVDNARASGLVLA